jgi:TonB-dependent receptor
LRASYSHTIARADYNSLQGGQTVDQLFRIANGTGSQGNPGLLPYKSKNIDLSAEWYYAPTSYLSIAYFHKRVSNFIGQTRVDTPAFGLTNPADGPRYQAAIGALGANATTTDIRNYIFTHYPDSVNITGRDAAGNYLGDIFGTPQDNALDFQISQPYNSDQKASIHGWEFGLQHNFWDTGFGVILNYTLVDGSADTANVVGFYDKNGIQARIAWDWRAKFLSGGGPNPTYVESYNQLDASASWEFRKNFSVFFEGINLTNSSTRQHQRSSRNVTYVSPGSARYAAGVRINF